jgi:hypothetical protein
MKKRDLREALDLAELQVRVLTAEIETMRKHWRPIPIPHPWQPKDPHCLLCDDPRDAPRHQEGTQ